MKFNLERIEDIINLTRQLAVGLRDLSFGDNFRNMKAEITIPATSEAQIRNTLNFIPGEYIIVSQTGNGVITKGTTEWSNDFLYLYNNGAIDVTITVRFFKGHL